MFDGKIMPVEEKMPNKVCFIIPEKKNKENEIISYGDNYAAEKYFN